MIQIKLLTITSQEYEEFEELFEEVERVELDQVAPEVVKGETDVKIENGKIQDYDAVFADIPPKNAVFGRVLLEMLEEKNIKLDNPSTAYFITAKKNYLYYVLHERDIPAPKTAVVATDKAARNLEKRLDPPVIARKLVEMKEAEKKLLEEEDSLQGFAEGSEYEEDVLIFHEYNNGEKYRCLVIGDQIMSIKDGSDGWKFQKDNLKYSNISDAQQEIVENAAKSLGFNIAEVLLRGEEIYDINPNPDLEIYTEAGGKNAYEAVAKFLKGER